MNTLKKIFGVLCATLLCMFTVNNTMAAVVTYYHNDISGSPIAATDAAGNLKWKESYKPYGEKLTRSAASSENKIGFHGKPHDDSTGLSYVGARYYDPVLGRFMSVDPKGFDTKEAQSFNRYAYTNNNPYRYVDPDGHSPVDVVFFLFDIGKLSVALYTGVGVTQAAADVAASAIGVVSPVPGTGLLLKARAAEQVVDSARSVARVADAAKAEKTYQTYTKTNPVTGQVYTGRTSGKGTAFENIASRDASHHKNSDGFGPAKLDKTSADAQAIRGREQMMIEKNGGAKSMGGTSGNAINGISPKNPNRENYMQKASNSFGKW